MDILYRLFRLGALVLAVGNGACQPDLAVSSGAGGSGGGGSGGGETISFSLEPPADPSAAPRAVRIRIRTDQPIDTELVRFVKGDVGPGHLKQLAVDDPSNALEERILPASVWSEGADVVVAPHALLESDERYAVAVPDRGRTFELRARVADRDPTLARLWPPPDAPAAEALLIFCGERDLEVAPEETSLAPDGYRARLEPGALPTGTGRRCARLQARDRVAEGVFLIPPPALESAGDTYGLEPTPLEIGEPQAPASLPLACEAGELPFGPGCARVFDDRAIVRTPAEARLWVIGGGEVDLVVPTAPGEPFAVHPLAAFADFTLEVASLDAAGRSAVSTFSARTSPPLPHVVLNEALANAVGPEPASEWIEIINDGALAVNLAGYVIADLGGEVALPEVAMAPGEVALVVGEGWTGDGLDDIAPPPGAVIVRVERIGRSGIANGGEPLRLRDPSGEIVSTIPSIDSPDPGMSTARREPWLADAPSSFVSAVPTPGAPNGAPTAGP